MCWGLSTRDAEETRQSLSCSPPAGGGRLSTHASKLINEVILKTMKRKKIQGNGEEKEKGVKVVSSPKSQACCACLLRQLND